MIRKPRAVLSRKADAEPGWLILLTDRDAGLARAETGPCDTILVETEVPTEDLDQRGAWPIAILADAFAPGVPETDILLPPRQHVLLNDEPIALADLVNGATILRRKLADVTWTCLLLGDDAPVRVAGLALVPTPAPRGTVPDQHYLRAMAVPALPPASFDLPGGDSAPAWRETQTRRAGQLGHVGTTDPALSFELAGAIIYPGITGRMARFRLPGSAGQGVLRTRWATPQAFLGGSDQRKLGVAVARIAFGHRVTRLDHWSLRGGWHETEPGWRWTDGAAQILVPAGAHQMEVEIANTLRLYPIS
jgi:hypothetical protein